MTHKQIIGQEFSHVKKSDSNKKQVIFYFTDLIFKNLCLTYISFSIDVVLIALLLAIHLQKSTSL